MLTLIPRGPADAGVVAPVRIGVGGATIGRAAGADLVLPDPRNLVSSRHCRIDTVADGYVLTDTSTNGTSVNGRRLTGPHRLAEGDVLTIGPWQVAVSFAAVAGAVPAAPSSGWDRPPVPPVGGTIQQPGLAAGGGGGDAVSQLLRAAGIPRTAIQANDAVILAAAGALLRQYSAGLMTMLEARAKARSELGVKPPKPTNNPLKQPGAPEPALAKLLGAPPAAEKAVAEAFAELDAHQRATLKAMQGALRTTLDELAPDAIKQRNGGGDAALWKAYAKAFGGSGSDSHFIEVFAGELTTAYEKLAAS